MHKSVLPLLRCPLCRNALTLHTLETSDDVSCGTLTCAGGHDFPIRCGVADFSGADQDIANQWEDLADGGDFTAFEQQMDAENPAEVVARRESVLSALANAIPKGARVVLDIATGRGLMLSELVKRLPEDVHIIAVDLSAYVLAHDRQKFRRIAPDRKITFLACDASRLPLMNGVIDAAVTYCGFSNMLGVAEAALQEAHRVLATDGSLADSFVVIQRDSKGYAQLHDVCRQHHLDGAEEFFLPDGVLHHHQQLFTHVNCETVFEGLGVGNGMDLLPYDGEWYAEQVLTSVK